MKNKAIFIIGSLLLFNLPAAAENINLQTPEINPDVIAALDFQHRFYGTLNNGTVIGGGSNVGIGLNAICLPGLEVNGAYVTYQKEFTLGAAYNYYIGEYAKTRIDLRYFNYSNENMADRRQNLFYNLAVSSFPLLDIVTPTINLGYDGYNQKLGLGLGVNAKFNVKAGPLDSISILGEYYPRMQIDENSLPYNSFALGLNFKTYGHDLILTVSNCTGIGTRNLMLGSSGNDISLGFNITRNFE